MSLIRGVAGAALCIVVSGCVETSFVLTDTRYAGRSPTEPEVFLDRLPPFPYISIGIIEVKAPGTADLEAIVTAAKDKGGEIGCDVVVDRGIHPVTSMIPNAGPLLAQTTPVAPFTPTPTTYYGGSPHAPERREFICGVRVAGRAKPAVAPAPAPSVPAPAPSGPAAAPPVPSTPPTAPQ